MAKGWESKSVESQMEMAEEERRNRRSRGDDPVAREREQKVKGLESSRTRIMHELAKATNERHRQVLQAALDHLNIEIAKL